MLHNVQLFDKTEQVLQLKSQTYNNNNIFLLDYFVLNAIFIKLI